MSGYARYATQFNNEAHLMAALTAMGCCPEKTGEHKYIRNRWSDSAPVDIRIPSGKLPKGVSYTGDVGFAKSGDGTYSLVASDMYGETRDKFLGQVGQEYNIARQTQAAEEQGLVLVGREVEETATGPRVQLQFVRR